MTHKLKNILLPGWAIDSTCYAGISDDMTEIVDFGFFSPASQGLLSVFDFCMTDVCDSHCIMTAHSLGSILAFGKLSDLHNVKALIVYSGFAKFAKADDNPYGQTVETIQDMKKQLMLNPSGLLKSFHRNMSFPSKYELTVPETLNVPALSVGLDILINCDFRSKLAEIKIPVLIIHGAQDMIVNVETADELAGNIRVSRLHVFKNAGHAVPFTHSNESKKITEKFLTDYDIHQYN
jgi:pimeloyl-ACP methyl ester carboxylesterase